LRLMKELNLGTGKEAASRLGEYAIRHSIVNSMHTLVFLAREKSVGGITFWLDGGGKGVTAVSILSPHGALRLPVAAMNYIASIKRLARKHAESSFMNGPGAGKNRPQARRH
jgi:hypothetical protein